MNSAELLLESIQTKIDTAQRSGDTSIIIFAADYIDLVPASPADIYNTIYVLLAQTEYNFREFGDHSFLIKTESQLSVY